MSDFVETEGGDLIPVANISRIIKRRDKDGVTIFTKDERDYAASGDIPEIASHGRMLIPANPGWSVVHYYGEGEEDGETFVRKVDVIAWVRDGSSSAMLAVTQEDGVPPDDIYFEGGGQWVLSPNGRVAMSTVEDYPTLDDWLRAMQRERRSRGPAIAEKEEAQS